MNSIKLALIVPVFNEEKTIIEILKKLQFLRPLCNLEIIVINDSSTDNTFQLLNNNKKLIDHLQNNNMNMGKGYSVLKGIKKSKSDYIMIQDADLEYNPKDITKFIEMIKNFSPDLIIGSRFKYDLYSRSHNFYNKIGNHLITLIFNLLNNTTFSDIYSCYVCFKKNKLNLEKIKSNGFEQQAEILSNIVKNGSVFFEVPINYNGRNHYDGKKIRFYHIFPTIYQLIKHKFFK